MTRLLTYPTLQRNSWRADRYLFVRSVRLDLHVKGAVSFSAIRIGFKHPRNMLRGRERPEAMQLQVAAFGRRSPPKAFSCTTIGKQRFRSDFEKID
jgi:hypothetical protein